MSTVTNIIVTAWPNEKDDMLSHLGFDRVDQHAGGDKWFEATVYMAAFNHCDLNQMIEWVRAAGWDHPEDVQVFIQKHEDEKFTER